MKKVICIVLVLCLVLAMTACSSKSSEPVDYTGTYDIVKIEAGDASADEAAMQQLRDMGYEAIMSFASDGTGLMSIAGEENDFTYDAATGMIDMGGSKSIMKFNDDGQLVVGDGGGTMYLEKRTEE